MGRSNPVETIVTMDEKTAALRDIYLESTGESTETRADESDTRSASEAEEKGLSGKDVDTVVRMTMDGYAAEAIGQEIDRPAEIVQRIQARLDIADVATGRDRTIDAEHDRSNRSSGTEHDRSSRGSEGEQDRVNSGSDADPDGNSDIGHDGSDRRSDATPGRDRQASAEGKNDAGDDSIVDRVEGVLDELGFEESEQVLTRRQAAVLLLRERGIKQRRIADRYGTSRANISSIEKSARENVRKARQTVEFVESLAAPVALTIEPGAELYDVVGEVYDACDEAGMKVPYTAPELMKLLSDGAGGAIRRETVREPVRIEVTTDGDVRVRST